MFPSIEALLASLAEATGAGTPPAGADGGVQFTVGGDTNIVLFGEDPDTLLLAAPVVELPKTADYGVALWLLRQDFYDSAIAPFRLGCDQAGTLVLWGRMPVEGMTGEQLAKVLDAMATEADRIRGELA
jgi:hypothetical protein